MIQAQTRLDVADNTGARKAMCIKVLGGSKRRYATLGDVIVATVKKALPGGDVKQGTIVRGVVVRAKKHVHRPDRPCVRYARSARLLGDDPRSTGALPMVPPAARHHGWTTVLERWLKAQVAPSYEPIDARALAPYADGLAAALRAAGTGTRAERMASRQVRRTCPGDQPAQRVQADRLVCLSPLVRETVVLSSDHVDK